MTKGEFLSGAKFRHIRNNTYIYQYEPPMFAHNTTGYLWQIIGNGPQRYCVAIFNEIGEESAAIDLVILGQYQIIKFNYSDFELC